METLQGTNKQVSYVQQLAKAGFDDVHTLRRETAERVLTRERIRLIKEISSGEVESVRDLARRVDRNVSIVSRDLDLLYEADIVEFEENGRSKRPVLAHENIMVNPVVFDGEVLDEDE